MKISIVIPAHEEENRIMKTLKDMKKLGGELIIVVDDEKTAKKLEKVKNVRILRLKKRVGKGFAVKEGVRIAKGDIIGFVDADGSIKAKEVKKMLRYLRCTQCVIASRRVSKLFIKIPFSRNILSLGFNFLVRSFLRVGVRDTQCGAKFFTKKLKGEVLKTWVCNGFLFDVEMLLRLKKRGIEIKEVGVKWEYIPGSKINIFSMFFILIELLKLMTAKILNIY